MLEVFCSNAVVCEDCNNLRLRSVKIAVTEPENGNIVVTEPDVAKVTFMFEAFKFDIVLAGLKRCQGKFIINSILLKVGKELFKA